MKLRDRLRVDARYRQGVALTALIYAIGYIVGHARGREAAIDALLHAAPDCRA